MPSRKELRAELTVLTHEAFASAIPLNKTMYSTSEANQIILQALISYFERYDIDSLLLTLNSSETNFSAVYLRSKMRAVYMTTRFHTPDTYNLVCHINTAIGERHSIGRNQAIAMLLQAAMETIHV